MIKEYVLKPQVGFETFKEGFVAVLSENVEGLSSEDDLDEDTQELVSTGTLYFCL